MNYLNSQIFYIDSHDLINGNHGDFSITLPLAVGKEVDTVVLLNASIKKSFYLIEDGKNTFILKEGDKTVIITIPEGNYGFTSFKIQLQSLLNTNSPNSWVYTIITPNTATSASTAKYTYNCVGGNPEFIFTDYIYEQMGFNINSINIFINNTLISIVPANFNIDVIRIHSDMIGNHKDNILQVINANVPDFSSMKYECIDIEANSKPLIKQSNTYRFFIMDEEGRQKDLTLNAFYTIMVYKKNDFSEQFYKMAIEYMRYKLLNS